MFVEFRSDHTQSRKGFLAMYYSGKPFRAFIRTYGLIFYSIARRGSSARFALHTLPLHSIIYNTQQLACWFVTEGGKPEYPNNLHLFQQFPITYGVESRIEPTTPGLIYTASTFAAHATHESESVLLTKTFCLWLQTRTSVKNVKVAVNTSASIRLVVTAVHVNLVLLYTATNTAVRKVGYIYNITQ